MLTQQESAGRSEEKGQYSFSVFVSNGDAIDNRVCFRYALYRAAKDTWCCFFSLFLVEGQLLCIYTSEFSIRVNENYTWTFLAEEGN